MRKHSVLLIVSITLILGLIHFLGSVPANAAGKDEIDRSVNSALEKLYNKYPAARELSKNAKAVLVFPEIIKGGFIVGGLYGDGALREGSKTVGYYNTVAASYGLQAGIQKYGYALFFMTDSALAYLDRSNGWELGVGPSIVVVDDGMARSLTTTTLKDDVYAFLFSHQGLMAGAGLQGSKITRIKK
jgi:lipid-binding SYLF domain-containing protein